MVLVDKPEPKDSVVFIRGEPTNRGPVAPRKFLTVLSYGKDEPFKDGSGRLELARHIADRENPLTARVIVNRVWQWHFGQAIVRTVNDFGTRSELPTHPELLDWMATWLMDNGWSLKKLHKLIVLSSTYQQSSLANDRGMRDDPTNQWLWRANVQRLDFESIRDTLLTIGGKLDRDVNGRPFLLVSSSASNRYKGMVTDGMLPKTSADRRTVYAMIDRNALPDMFGTFDFANPDMSTGERIMTTVPQQALFMMNSPFVVEQVKNLLAREDFPKTGVDEDKVRVIFRTALQRQPTSRELVLARNFLSDDPPEITDPSLSPQADDDTKTRAQKALALKALQPSKQLNLWELYTQTVLQMNELIFRTEVCRGGRFCFSALVTRSASLPLWGVVLICWGSGSPIRQPPFVPYAATSVVPLRCTTGYFLSSLRDAGHPVWHLFGVLRFPGYSAGWTDASKNCKVGA